MYFIIYIYTCITQYLYILTNFIVNIVTILKSKLVYSIFFNFVCTNFHATFHVDSCQTVEQLYAVEINTSIFRDISVDFLIYSLKNII